MSGLGDKLSRMSPIKLALAANEMRGRAAVVNAEPLAIIGIGCRFPGNADSPESFWRLLSDGVDAISDVPAERWDKDAFYDPVPHTPGKMISRRGGFARHLQEFDADFFGISPREATTMDPQQRTLLEVAWETIENAGIPHGSLVGTTTGVFVGISGIDYFMHLQACDQEIDAYLGTGNALSVASGRLSYVLGLQGPSVSVDTACSSSLVAVHLACQSLRNRECDAALAGGTHRIILPHGSIGLSQAHLLAPDGRCKTFDSSADGYVRGEGCGMVLLKRLSDAIADGDRIAALVRGSAINQDGKTSGLTVPNGPAQQAVLRKALQNAAVDADQVGYLEAHGTGTPLGDPIEVTALAGVFGNRRVGPPLLIGSVKTNVGHLEAAAGIAGLLKVVLSLQHKEIPPHLHLTSPNPHIPWKSLPIAVATKRTPWPGIDGERIGGVSSFSFSGTNAHAVLQETPPELVLQDEPSDELTWTPHLLTLSAKTPQALRALALRYESYFKEQDDPGGDALYAVCQTASSGRTHFSQRLSVLADSPQEARSSLSDWIAGTPSAAVVEGRRTKAPRVGFYFETRRTAGPVGRELYERQRHFRSAVEPANGIWNGESSEQASFAVEIALAETWKALGIAPAFVAGRGVGEFAAACFAGVFGFDAGMRLLAPESEESTRSLTSGIHFASPRIPLLSSATGRRIHDEVRDSEYWLQRLRELRRPESAAGRPETSPCDAVLGIGLSDPGRVPEAGCSPFSGGTWVPTLSASRTGDWRVLMKGLAVLYACGASPNWDALYEDRPRRRVPLPTYPFQRERFWVDPKVSPEPGERLVSSIPPPESSRAPARIDRARLLAGTDVERRAALEEYVTEQLADILRKPRDLIAAHEPLQSVGIDSLMAMELKYRIEADLSIALEIRSLDPDYALTHLVDDVLATFEGSRSTEPIPRIGLTRDSEGAPAVSFLSAHGDGGRRPLFFIHPGGIDISTYLAFAEHLDPSQPVHVLQPHGLYGGHFDQGEDVVEATIAQAASLCASEVSRRHPEGPYCLAGWSMGGLVAYEMTRQLVSAGRPVALLGLLDVMCGPARDGSTLVAWFADLLEARTGRPLNYSFGELMALNFEAQVESIWSKAVASEAVHPSMPLEEFRMLFDRYKDALVASSYRTREYTLDPRLCAERVVFFNCVELARPERRAVETLFDWSAYSPNGLEIRSVPGNHYSMLFEPAVGALAAGIQRCLDDIDGAPRTPEPVSATPADPAPDSPVRR